MSSTCQYPLERSSVEKYGDSSVSCNRGRGNASLIVRLFRWRKSTRNRNVPSFLDTINMGNDHGLELAWLDDVAI
jgi:hypothetical protein